MNTTIRNTLIVIGILVLAVGAFYAGSLYRTNAYGPAMMFGGAWNGSSAFGPGMMGGGRGGSGMGPGMMGGYGWNNGANLNVTPLTVDQARAAAQKYIQSNDLQGLEIGEVMIFEDNAYVVVNEGETGLGAFELLVDPVSRMAYPEYGPNMMWNLKYGGMNHGQIMGGRGMMGGYYGMMNGWNFQATPSTSLSAEMTVDAGQAVEYAQQYLDANYPGAVAADHPVQFYGYYTLDFTKDGAIAGMLSVNGYNGQVFVHTWHGTFVEEAE